ncbi:hypothetical protein [Aestuariibaculum suncheonense]|uniref:Uncharacterized protein n=1 Tax=Aestuariibaculum suncheonense TaxID=1028745 RepID=A0A8J6Q3M6_9FLAO|nr:hypothetical protein [Aestuariibaculum suncheonense]MBD0833839.1 hypothetical protein [Aestuariibaculum suncheonense]
MEITKVYFQNVDSVKAIYVVANVKQKIILDHVYFKGKQARLEQVNDSLFIGHFFKDSLKKKDVIMTNEPYGEYGNTLPHLPEKSPFDLKENECIIAFKVGDEVHFLKYSNVEKR